MDIPILKPPLHRWACPNCSLLDATTEARPHSRMHTCSGLGGLTAPMVPADSVEARNVRVVANIREDYVGGEHPTFDDSGRPIMAVETQHADGHTDLAVLAPVADTKAIGGLSWPGR